MSDINSLTSKLTSFLIEDKQLNEMSQASLQSIEDFADKEMDPLDIEFTSHFFNRLNDPRNLKPISPAELIGFFKRLARKKDQLIDFLKKYKEVVATDNRTNINIPLIQQVNSAIAKTIMRKKDFQTTNPKIQFNEAKQLGKLYHFTNFNGLTSILDSNTFRGSEANVDKDDLDFKSFNMDAEKLKSKDIYTLYFFSTTRDKLLYLKDPKIKGSVVRIVLDGDKLSNKYKVSPFYFYHDEMIDEPNPKYDQDESEERIILGTKKDIPNADDYIKEIHIILDKIEGNQDYILKISQLIEKYGNKVQCFYKEKPILIDEYIKIIQSQFDSVNEGYDNQLPTTLKDAMLSLTTYMIENDMNILPLPSLKLIDNDSNNADNIFGQTAYYNPNECSITLFTLNRHPKDILRSYSHEMIHRIQDNEGRLKNINTTNTNEDGELLELEKEAYLNGNITFRNWEDSLKNPKPVNEVYFLDTEKYNRPRTIHENLWYTLNEITLTPDNAVETYGGLTGGRFQVGNITYMYDIKQVSNPYNDGGRFFNIMFHPEENVTSTPQEGKENYIKILSTMYKVILDFAEEAEPEYIGIASMDNNNSKNYHMVYANLTDNKSNRIPGYSRKDISLPFDTPQGKGRFVVLKRIDV